MSSSSMMMDFPTAGHSLTFDEVKNHLSHPVAVVGLPKGELQFHRGVELSVEREQRLEQRLEQPLEQRLEPDMQVGLPVWPVVVPESPPVFGKPSRSVVASSGSSRR